MLCYSKKTDEHAGIRATVQVVLNRFDSSTSVPAYTLRLGRSQLSAKATEVQGLGDQNSRIKTSTLIRENMELKRRLVAENTEVRLCTAQRKGSQQTKEIRFKQTEKAAQCFKDNTKMVWIIGQPR